MPHKKRKKIEHERKEKKKREKKTITLIEFITSQLDKKSINIYENLAKRRETMTIFKNQFKDFDDQINNNRSPLFYEKMTVNIFFLFFLKT